jgi:4-amino-4-deoxy-L-arabinose transferase-like glycosyltransferase
MGLAVAIAIVLPWAIAIGIASHGLFYQSRWARIFAAKLMGEQEAHGAPPGYYTLLVNSPSGREACCCCRASSTASRGGSNRRSGICFVGLPRRG